MTKRSVQNDRNNPLLEEKRGASRKSASSAKPKREAAGSVYIESTKKTKQEKKAEQRRRDEETRRIDEAVQARVGGEVTNDKIKKWRRVWWVALAIAILCTIFSWTAQERMPTVVTGVVMAFAYVFIIFALYIDLGIIRKERKRLATAMDADDETKRIYREETKRVRAEMRAEAKAKAAGENTSGKAGAQSDSGEKDEAKEDRKLFGGFKFGKKDAGQGKKADAEDKEVAGTANTRETKADAEDAGEAGK